ncbi:hypothetical protein [Dietzia sp. CH92]|uniref:hypothetical protein n=1 Tax=Dietzia sp. CH92 TaxID=3051823 RepID=UPI0028D61ABE|nr:hypothetical protein [Dietzia sp. CH92]
MRTPLLAVLGAAAALSLVAPGTAAAQQPLDSDTQEVSFRVVANELGGLSVNTGGSNSTLGLAADGGTASGTLTAFSITDTRGTTTGWNAYLALTDFVHTSDARAIIPATKATYRPPASANGLVLGGTANRVAETIPLKNSDTLFMTRTTRDLPTTLEIATIPNVNAMTVDLSDGAALGQYKATLTLSAL